MQFQYHNPTHILFGQNQIANITQLIQPEQKILVLYGGGSIKKNGVYEQVKQALTEYQWLEFSGIEPNPTKETLDKAVSLVKTEKVDFILAVGGGSVIDGAKYVAAAACYEGDGWDILTKKYQVNAAVPLGAILTLPATGSESNAGAVITKAQTHDKLSFMSPFVQPAFAVMDPDTMKTLPDRQLINGLVDAWVHICEQYITKPQNAMVQDGFAEALLKNLLVLGKNFDQHNTDEWRSNLMWTANQALNGLIGAGVLQDWSTHALGHELTALYGIDHARSLAIIQPSLLRNQIKYKAAKLEQMGRNVFGLTQSRDLATETINAIESFFHSLGVATSLTCEERQHQLKNETIQTVISQLEKHGMTAIGENKSIDLNASRTILEGCIS